MTTVTPEPSRAELEAAFCWEPDDHVPKQPTATAYRRRMRLHQARWREAHGLPIGTQPLVPRHGQPTRPVGSRLPVDDAIRTGATFLTDAAREAATTRLSSRAKEAHQSLDATRTWADLLWRTAFTFNLFGDLAADLDLADRCVHAWWPDAPGRVVDVRFEHSPGRLDPSFLGNLCAFSVAFILELGGGHEGVIGVSATYADAYRRQAPKPERLTRYVEVTERSATFDLDQLGEVDGTELIHLWLDHQLVHSMLQHPSKRWAWGRLVCVHPAGNVNAADACTRYRSLLVDDTTFRSATVETLLDAGAIPPATATAFTERYLPTPTA